MVRFGPGDGLGCHGVLGQKPDLAGHLFLKIIAKYDPPVGCGDVYDGAFDATSRTRLAPRFTRPDFVFCGEWSKGAHKDALLLR